MRCAGGVASLGFMRSRDSHFFPGLLLSDGAVAMKPSALKEAVTHHAVAEQKKDDCQEDYKQEVSNSERRWLSSCRARRI
jgi:hypothetical protein